MLKVFIFGLGYSASAVGAALLRQGWQVTGTARTEAKRQELEAQGFEAVLFSDAQAVREHLQTSTHILISAPPGEGGDPVLRAYHQDLTSLSWPGLTRPSGISPIFFVPDGRVKPGHDSILKWIGYLSTIGVYGDYGGAWIDETAELKATSGRGRARVDAEKAWTRLAHDMGVRLDIFRLAGIYGPGRNQLDKLKQGKTQSIIKEGQVFNRIHVDDIAGVVLAAMAKPAQDGGSVRLFNVTDNEPAPPQDVLSFAAELINAPPPPAVPFEEAQLSPMARSFYDDNKRVRNDKIKAELGVILRYPTYREGLNALASGEK